MNNIKVAIVHDWLTGMRGGEKCLEVFCELFPAATLFTLVHTKGSTSPIIENMDIRTSFLQRMPRVAEKYRSYLPLFTRAIESFDLTGYDLVITSSHCVAKGVKTPPGALNICYCYTPVRYAWKFFNEYFGRENAFKKWVIGYFMDRLRRWDLESNKRIDYFIAISHNVKNRVREYYDRDADVIYPPVDVNAHGGEARDEGYYLVVSALVPYKRVDLAVNAFNKNDRRLIVIGEGSEKPALQATAMDNVSLLGRLDDEEVARYYAGCRALIFPGEEDFGIVPLEAQAYGKPVVAYAAGGALETIVPFAEPGDPGGATGVFFDEQTTSALNGAVSVLEDNIDRFDPRAARRNAERFSRARFKEEFGTYVREKWDAHVANKLSAVSRQLSAKNKDL